MIKFKIKLKNWYFHGGADKVAAFLLGVALGKRSSLIAIIAITTLIPYIIKDIKFQSYLIDNVSTKKAKSSMNLFILFFAFLIRMEYNRHNPS